MKILLAAALAIAASFVTFSQTAEKHKPRSLPSAFMQAGLVDKTGASINLNSYRGRVVLVHMWGNWCRPCRADVPSLISLEAKYRERGFYIIGVNVGDAKGGEETWQTINSYAEQLKIPYRLVKVPDGEEFIKLFDKLTGAGEVVPQTILLDRFGRMRGTFAGSGAKVDESREKLIAEVVNER